MNAVTSRLADLDWTNFDPWRIQPVHQANAADTYNVCWTDNPEQGAIL